ncbi:MAG TPA: DUF1398 family protein [Ferruginibacter sp.]|nr:DUF1398 family protein [Ferruginibacter sp.]
MFTIEQIKATHAKVKSGADFPKYVQEMKVLGITSYEHYVSDGHILYKGNNGFSISADAKWETRHIASEKDTIRLQHFLSIHQDGQTDYPTFCKQAAVAGVEKWVVDMIGMTCIYYDTKGNEMVVEKVPMA